jgi:hypothetical protein
MTPNEVILEGTIKSDGTLELNQKPKLPPGRVTVVLRQDAQSAPPAEDWWQFMQRTRRELEAAGSDFMNQEEVEAHIDWLREGDRIDDLLREADQERQPKEHGGC